MRKFMRYYKLCRHNCSRHFSPRLVAQNGAKTDMPEAHSADSGISASARAFSQLVERNRPHAPKV